MKWNGQYGKGRGSERHIVNEGKQEGDWEEWRNGEEWWRRGKGDRVHTGHSLIHFT